MSQSSPDIELAIAVEQLIFKHVRVQELFDGGETFTGTSAAADAILALLRSSDAAATTSSWLEGQHGGTYRRLTAIRDGARLGMPTARAIADALDSLLYADLAQASTDHCAKCGCETKGEMALVDGEIWCHPCADALDEARWAGK